MLLSVSATHGPMDPWYRAEEPATKQQERVLFRNDDDMGVS